MKADRNSETIAKLTGARSVKELLSIIQGIEDGIDKIDKSTNKLLSSVSSTKSITISLSNAAREIELGDIGGRRTRQVKAPAVKTILQKFTVPDFSALTKNTETLAQLNQYITELEVAEQVLVGSSQLSDAKASQGALESIRALTEEARTTLHKQLTAMTKIARKTSPKQHTALTKYCVSVLEETLDKSHYTNIDTKTFVYHDKSDPIRDVYYQTYIFVNNLTNLADEVYDHYAMVLTAVVNVNTGELRHYLTSMKDQRIPGSFTLGEEVASGQKLKTRIVDLLSVDDFFARGSRRTLPLTTQDLRKNVNLGGAKNIGRLGGKALKNVLAVRVQNDEVYVRLAQGLSDAERKASLEDILVALRTVLKMTTTTKNSISIQELRSRSKGVTWFRFYVTDSNKSRYAMTNQKLKQLAEALDLSPEQMSSIRQSLK
jgi:hypothetical protein